MRGRTPPCGRRHVLCQPAASERAEHSCWENRLLSAHLAASEKAEFFPASSAAAKLLPFPLAGRPATSYAVRVVSRVAAPPPLASDPRRRKRVCRNAFCRRQQTQEKLSLSHLFRYIQQKLKWRRAS